MDPVTAFWIAQSVSVVTGIMAMIMMQLKNMKLVLIFEIIVNLLVTANFLLLDGGAGAITNMIGVIYAVLMYFYNKKNAKVQLPVLLGFIAAYIACSVYSIIITHDLMEILPAMAAVSFVLALMQKKTFYFRIWGALNCIFWLPYDLYTRSYVISLVHLGILISSIVSMIRYDDIFKKKNNT